MLKDKHFGAAILAAPFFLIAFTLLRPVTLELELSWPLHAPARFLLPALVYPVLEEAAFRGLLQGTLVRFDWGRRSRAGISGANLLTSIAFTACHVLYHPPAWAAAVFVPSLIYGYFRDRTGSIRHSVALHAWYNAGYFWIFGL